jgi:predicted transposase YdaD
MDLRYNDIFLKGKEQGLSQGLFQGKEEEKERRTIEIISNGLKLDLSLEVTASMADVSVEEVKQYIKDNHLDEK